MRIERARPYVVKALHAALNPRSIAVVGASRNPNKVGYQVCKELMDWHFKGEIIPVNPRATEILGLKAYPTLRDIPHPVDLVFVAVPAHLVKSIIEDAVAAKATCAVVATSNFKETGRADLQDEITSYCREHKLPLIGPNLVGLGSPYDSFNCGFIPYLPIPGHVGMISQSGANLLAALGTSQKDHYGMSFFVGLGNKADVDFAEFIEYADEDPHTGCIGIYAEGIDSPEAFEASAKKVHKPIVAIKVGRSKIGVKAAFAHTASENADPDKFFDDLFARAGVIRATTWQEFLDMTLALGMMPPAKGENIVMITNGGGAGLLACDHFERIGYPLKELKDISPELREKIRAYMPSFGSPLNPVDISGTADVVSYEGAFMQAMTDSHTDGVLGAICPTAVTDVPGVAQAAVRVVEATKGLNKPFVMICQGGQECQDAIMYLRDHDIPAYPTAEQAVNAMVALRRYGEIAKSKK